MRINQNIMAFNSYRNLSATNTQLGKSLEKLSSGFRINRAADDAAGLVVSEGLRAQVSGLQVATRNAQDGTSVVQTAEGALTEVHSMLRRMRDLTLQASNTGANDADARAAAQAEIDQLTAEIDRVASDTKFGQVALLDGNYGVTQASHTGAAAAAYVVDAATDTGNEFKFTLGSGGQVDVLLADKDYTAGTNINDLASDVENAIRAALYADNQDGSLVSVTGEVAANGTDIALSITTADGNAFTLAAGDTSAGVTENALGVLGLSAGTYSSSGTGGLFQVGANSGETITVAITSMTATALGVNALDVTTSDTTRQNALDDLDDAIAAVSTQRGDLGAIQNRFEHTIANLSVTAENLAASESRIRDTDMALELVSFTRHQILQQAGTAMLAQANSVPQSVLSLLR